MSMDEFSTPALMACIAAVMRESDRLRAKAFGAEPLLPPVDRIIGDYRIDLGQAFDILVEEYENRRSEDSTLAPLADLAEFYRQAD
jgi:hypothetical protein